MGRFDACSPIPPPPSDWEKSQSQTYTPPGASFPDEDSPELVSRSPMTVPKGVSKPLVDYVQQALSQWGMARFAYYWLGHFEDWHNQITLQFFLRTFRVAMIRQDYGQDVGAVPVTDELLSAVYYTHIVHTLQPQFKAQAVNPNILIRRRDDGKIRKSRLDVRDLKPSKTLRQSLADMCNLKTAM